MDRESLRWEVAVTAIVTTLIGGSVCCFVLAAVVVALVPVQHTTFPPPAVPAATARLTPSEAEIGVGETTTVTLHVQDVTDLYGYQVAIDFDPDVVEVVDADVSRPGLQVALGVFLRADFVQQNAADNGTGTIVCVITELAPRPAVTGSGDLLTIALQAKAQGTSAIHLADLKLANVDGIEIPAARHDAQVTVRP